MQEGGGKEPDPELLNAAIYANSFKTSDPWFQSTGFRSKARHYRTLHHSLDDSLAEAFLINTRLRRNDPEAELSVGTYLADPGIVMLSLLGEELKAGWREVSLPAGVSLGMPLGKTIARRRSIRGYTGDPMEMGYLASIVRSAAGVTASAEVKLMGGGEATLKLRAAPSGGGLYPIHLFLAALNVKGLERGIYRYVPVKDKLWQTGESAAVDSLLHCFAVPESLLSISRADVLFLLVAQPWRTLRKYGSRGMRYIFLEAGSMAENINLAAASLGFGTVECASVYDDEAHEAMNIDGLYETLVHTVVLGCPG
jgi:SagB-type dehydrogenase family enzyme